MTTTLADPAIAPPEVAVDPAERRDRAAERRDRHAALRRRRRRLMLWGLPFAVLALAFAAKFGSMIVVGNHTVASYAGTDYEGALNSAQQQKFLNLVERWKAPYNTGTVYLQLGLDAEARIELEAALPLASGAEQCPVRSNLAIAIERLGDAQAAAGDADGAVATWQEGLAVLREAPPECPQSASATPMDETQQRLESKLSPTQGGQGDEGDPPPPDSSTGDVDQDTLDQLDEQLDQNQNDRQDQIDENNNSNAGGGGTDTPW